MTNEGNYNYRAGWHSVMVEFEQFGIGLIREWHCNMLLPCDEEYSIPDADYVRGCADCAMHLLLSESPSAKPGKPKK